MDEVTESPWWLTLVSLVVVVVSSALIAFDNMVGRDLAAMRQAQGRTTGEHLAEIARHSEAALIELPLLVHCCTNNVWYRLGVKPVIFNAAVDQDVIDQRAKVHQSN